jgi:hypothetical protein
MKKFLVSIISFFSISIYAQQDLTVTVIDKETQQPISNLTLKLTNFSRNLTLEQISNQQGKATFRNLSALDGYQVFFEEAFDYASESSDLFSVRSNQSPSIVLVLRKLASQTLEEVVVSSSTTSKINRRDAEVSSELKATEIQEIPVEGRDITRVLYRLPNVTQATGFYPEAPNVSINGANGLFATI